MDKNGKQVNYVYFGLLFLFLSFLHIYQIFLIENGAPLHRFFYIVHAIGQCFIEVGVLGLIGNFLVQRFPRILNPIFIVMTFILFMIHIIDFPLVRIMDISIWYGLDLISSESFDNFVEMLYATHISIKVWLIAGIVALVLPIFGIIFFRMTEAIARKKPLNFTYPTAGLTLLAIILFLSLFDFRTYKLANPDADPLYLKALPWKTTLFPSSYPMLTLKGSLKPTLNEEMVLKDLTASSCTPLHKPNLFLFVIESLREDYLTEKNAPALSKFKHENIAFDLSFSSANATALSWFSIFHSKYPFYWKQTKSGSLPLRILKKAGYKTHVYSSSRIGFYNMDDILFGPGHKLADTLHLFAPDETVPSYESDKKCFDRMLSDFEAFGKEGGHLFIVFLESTHFDYSWPKRSSLEFTPVDDSIDYFKATFLTENLEGIKNRYRNAIYYLDSLFGNFYEKIVQKPWGEEAAVVVTGDHGEEFYEEGHLFHASNLSDMQTQVPIYYRFGKVKKDDLISHKITSHVDIFPSLLNYVFGENVFKEYFDGESIFHEKKRPFAISGRFNLSREPYEFFIHNGESKIVTQFVNARDIFKSPGLRIISKKDSRDTSLNFDLSLIEQELEPALKYLFP